ncbi:MAG: hypothetical protein HYT80_06940 [Euryarchaeota archaeon]|nr:hypothetical protein [Euryarchaeota archaeon]
MQIVDANALVGTTVEGTKGSITVMPAHDEPLFGTQVIVIPPNVKAPKQGTTVASKTLLFVLQGSATLTNGEYYQKVTPGKLVILDAGEERVFQTEKEKCVCLEVRFGPPPPPAPVSAPVVVELFTPPVAEAPAKRSTSVYDEV